MKTYGVDVSKHNGTVDYEALKKAGNTFVIIRAGYSTTPDPKFEENYKRAKAAGLHIGAYWYSYALNTTAAYREASKCLEVIKGKTFDFPVWFDMEDADGYKKKNGMPSNKLLVSICDAFCKTLEASGYYTGVYASESWFKNQLKTLPTSLDRWGAAWGSNSGKHTVNRNGVYRLHQFTSKYELDGKTFDRNVCYYDYPAVIKKAGLNGYSKPKAAEKKPETYYYVRKGDTLSAIAKRFGTTVEQLKNWNGIKNANIIYSGQRIRVS